MKAEEQLVK